MGKAKKRLKRMKAKISVFCCVMSNFVLQVGGSLLMLRASIVSNETVVMLLEMWTSTIAPCLDKLSLQSWKLNAALKNAIFILALCVCAKCAK